MDVGSTLTKAVLVESVSGELLATAEHPTTRGEVLAGIAAVRERAERTAGRTAGELLVCSSAGGGLRLAVVGYEREVTAEAGRRVALSAGGRVVHLTCGRLEREDVDALRAARPDVVLLTGGTDGGNADVVVHNARRLGIGRVPAPVVLAANADAVPAAEAELLRRGRRVTVTGNVLPRIGTLDPLPARRAIREAFLTHVIGGKGLSRPGARLDGRSSPDGRSTPDGRSFAQLVRAATPDAVLEGAALLAPGEDTLVVDVGGATTDVYSVRSPDRAAASGQPARQAVADLWHARTVEGDLGMRAGATGLLEAAVAEGLLTPARAAELAARPGRTDPAALSLPGDAELAGLALLVAVRRHGRPERPGTPPRPLREVSRIVGSGGVLRHADPAGRRQILAPLLRDHGGGWAVPDRAGLAVDEHSVLFAAGLLAPHAPAAAEALARNALTAVPH